VTPRTASRRRRKQWLLCRYPSAPVSRQDDTYSVKLKAAWTKTRGASGRAFNLRHASNPSISPVRLSPRTTKQGWVLLFDEVQDLATVPCLTHHAHVGCRVQDKPDAKAHRRVTVRYDYPRHKVTSLCSDAITGGLCRRRTAERANSRDYVNLHVTADPGGCYANLARGSVPFLWVTLRGAVHTPKPLSSFDPAKKVEGRKRHQLVETEGLVLKAKVHSVNVPDQDGLRLLLESARARLSRLRHLWVDGGYQGSGRGMGQGRQGGGLAKAVAAVRVRSLATQMGRGDSLNANGKNVRARSQDSSGSRSGSRPPRL
jgi:hypothetical protein